MWRPEELHKLRTIIAGHAPPARRSQALAALEALERCLAFARAMGAPTSTFVQLDARLALPEHEYASGLQLQLAVQGHGVLLRGGRYDQLAVSMGVGERVAAGMSIYLGRLLRCLEQNSAEQQHAADSGAAGGALTGGLELDVLVCSAGDGMADARMGVLGQLWQAGLRADASPSESSNLRSHMELAAAAGAQHLGIVSHSTVRIKHLRAPGGGARGSKRAHTEEEQVPLADVAKYFLNRGLGAALVKRG